MPFQPHRPNVRGTRRRRRHRITLKTVRRFIRLWSRAFRKVVATYPPPVQVLVVAVCILFVWTTINWMYHTIHKPTEIFFPLDDSLDKRPVETWRQYGALFRKHSTAVITPELLAALAQVEGDGNPVARTYWRWNLASWNPFELYRPASSAVGMYQITDGTFQEAKRYCIHDHAVVTEGSWHDMRSCWFNSLYTRILPSHAIEMTAALLDRRVARAIGDRRQTAATLQQKQDLAALIHLCGAGAGQAYVTGRFRLAPRQRCGDHEARTYLARINAMKRQFVRLAAAD